MTEESTRQYIASSKEVWKVTVHCAYTCSSERMEREVVSLARDSSTNPAVLRRKFQAIQFKRDQGWTEEAIVAAGQGPTLSSYAADRKTRQNEKQRHLRWKVPASLADAVETEVVRIATVLGLTTSEDLWDFWLSVMIDLTPPQLRHLAGQPKLRKK